MTIHNAPLDKETVTEILPKEGGSMAKQKSITLPEFLKRYGDENACREHLFAIRWPHGFICPKCGHTE
jgi:hypothetical protein